MKSVNDLVTDMCVCSILLLGLNNNNNNNEEHIFTPGQKYRITLKNEEKDIVYSF